MIYDITHENECSHLTGFEKHTLEVVGVNKDDLTDECKERFIWFKCCPMCEKRL
jgi:hypothetical protein